MRHVALGHWHYYTWHLPALLFTLVGLVTIVGMCISLRRNEHSAAATQLRLKVIGWSAIIASLGATVAWPYLSAVSNVNVERDGTWRLENYLGITLATIPAGELRAVRAADLGGLGWGSGFIEIRRSSGAVVRTVRVNREVLSRATLALGYPPERLQSVYGDQVIAPHRYASAGPQWSNVGP